MKKQKRNTEKNIAIGKKIKLFRKKKGLTQEKLGVKTHLTQTHISLLEAGQRGISLTTLGRISSALDCKVKDLIPF